MEWTAEEKEMIEKTKQALAGTAPTASGRSAILRAAEKMVTGKREQDYGSPEDNFQIIANLWEAYKGYAFSPDDVAMMMILLKIARAYSGVYCADNYIDIAGYAACAGEIAERRSKE